MAERLYREFSPLQIALVYFLVAGSLLVVFDLGLPLTGLDPVLVDQIQGIKGGVEIGATALLIYGLTYSSQHSLEATNEELAEANQVLEVLFRLFRHNLRNDVNVIRGYTKLLEGMATTPREREAVRRVLESVDDVVTHSRKAGWTHKVVSDDTERVVIDLVKETETVASDLGELYPEATITVDADVDALVEADSLFHRAIEELVENAIVHNDADRPRVAITVTAGPETVDLVVEDDGPGIPEVERRTLDRERETPIIHTSGLGLWQVYWTVAASDGEVEIRDRPSGGTEVSVSLPAADAPGDRRLARLQQYLMGGSRRRPEPRDPTTASLEDDRGVVEGYEADHYSVA